MTLLVLAACGGGGGGGGGGNATAPSNLEYPSPVRIFLVDIAVAPEFPTYDGSPSTFSIQPSLPSGLSLNAQTGAITGTPTQAFARQDFTVRASNSGGSTTVVLSLGAALPARFAYLVNQYDSTINVCAMDAKAGRIRHLGYQVMPGGQSGPELMAVHPNGKFAYVANQNSSNVSAFSIDTEAGWLTAGSPVAVGSGPHNLAIDPSGSRLYVTSQGSDQLHVFSINAATGALALLQLMPTGIRPSGCAVDPTGSFLFVTLHGVVGTGQQSAMQTYDIDPGNGTVSVSMPSVSLNGSQPTDLSVDPMRPVIYVSLERFDFVVPVAYDPATGALTMGTADHTGDRPLAVSVEPTGRFTYVANRNDGTVSSFAVDQTTGDLTPITTTAAGSGTLAFANDPAGRFLFVLNSGSRNVQIFRIEAATGALVSEGTLMTRSAPTHVAFASGAHPLSFVPRFLHVAAASSDEIPTYTIAASSGSLTEVPNAPLTDDRPVAIATDPRHRFLYVANQEGRSIGTFTINPTNGVLTAVGAPAPVTGRPTHVTVDPSGRFLYVTARDVVNTNDGWVTTWTINQNDGSIAQADTHQVGNLALWSGLDPTGSYLFVASKGSAPGTGVITKFYVATSNGALTDLGSPESASGIVSLGFHPFKPALYAVLGSANAVVTFTMDPASGDLTVVTGGAANGGVGPTAMVVSPDARFAYASYYDAGGNGHVSEFEVDPATSKLLMPAVQYQDGLHPSHLALDGSGRTLYVANAGSNDISVFMVDPATGSLTLGMPRVTGLEPCALAVTTITQ